VRTAIFRMDGGAFFSEGQSRAAADPFLEFLEESDCLKPRAGLLITFGVVFTSSDSSCLPNFF
jgi:hypothetical protein